MAVFSYKNIGLALDLENWDDLNENFSKVAQDFRQQDGRIDDIVSEITEEVAAEIVDSSKVIRLEPVANFAALSTSYPNAKEGDAAQTLNDGKVYRYSGGSWLFIEQYGQGPISAYDNRLSELTKVTFTDRNRARLFEYFERFNRTTTKKVTMVGDSLTSGVSSGGHPYFEPFTLMFPNINFINKGIGGNTTKDVIARLADIKSTDADLYVIGVGTNDIRYADSNSALTPTEYVANMKVIIDELDPNYVKTVCINPWVAFDKDTTSTRSYYDRDKTSDAFSAALAKFCFDRNIPFIETNKELRRVMDWGNKSVALVDSIHPRYPAGVQLYADVTLFGKVNGADYGLNKTQAVGKHLYRIEIVKVSRLETSFDNFSLKRLYADKNILEIWSDNMRSGYLNPQMLFETYNPDTNVRFSNGVGQYPINVTFSTNEPITELYQLEQTLFRSIGQYKVYYSTNPDAIVDVYHPSWALKYANSDTDDKINNLLYAEPIELMEQRRFYRISLTPKNNIALRLKRLASNQKIIGTNSAVLSSAAPLTGHLIKEHQIETSTGTSSTGYVFFSTSRPISTLTLELLANSATYDITVATSQQFASFNKDQTDTRWAQIYSSTNVSVATVLTATIPAH